MFGGIAFMVSGNMACGVIGEDLIVRLGDDDGPKALEEPGVREFDFTGKAMKSIVYVGPEATAGDDDLTGWVDAGAAYARVAPREVATLEAKLWTVHPSSRRSFRTGHPRLARARLACITWRLPLKAASFRT